MSQRFFIALLPPNPIQESIREIQYYFRDRYDSKAALKSPPHITIFPPFEWAEENLHQLQRELETFGKAQSPFQVNLSGFAAFPPRVIYVHVEPSDELQNLYLNICNLVQNCGIENPHTSRPFVPHITVGFRDLTLQKFEEAWQEFSDRPISFEFSVNSICLLKHDGNQWNVMQSYDLVFRGRHEAPPLTL
jgi:2'-5' RNA ligase